MIYEKRLTIPKNTPQASPVTTTLPIHPGIVERVSVSWPPGPSGLAHVQIWYWERQLWPANPDSDFYGDDEVIDFPEDLEIVDPPFEFTIKGWNLDDTYPHTPIIRLQITPRDKNIRSIFQNLLLGATGPITPVEG